MTGLEDVRLRLVRSTEDAAELLHWLSERDRIAIDTETTGLSPEVDRVRLVQFGDEDTAWAVPFGRWGGVVEDVVARFEGLYDAHNAPFDVAMLRAEGIRLPVHRVHDTRLMAHVLDSRQSIALKNLARRHVDPRAGAGQEALEDAIGPGKTWTWATVPVDFQPYWVYGALDTVLTSRVRAALEPLVRTQAPASYDLELAAAWVCEKMERAGVRVDREYTEAFAVELRGYLGEAAAWCETAYGVGPGSTAKIVELLLRDGVALEKTTASGARYSLDKEVLAGIDHPLGATVLGHRQAQKLLGTYLETYLELSARDGRVHPSINSVGGSSKNPYEPGGGRGVRTGRMSSDNPNMQNVPVRTKEGKRIRRCFVPDDGHGGDDAWVKCDADQVEMRILAHLADDGRMREAFAGEGDFFVNVARELFAEPDFRKEDPRRQMVKNGGYAKIYGAGSAQFARTAGVPVEVGAAFMRRFDETFPGVPAFTRRVEREALAERDATGEASVRSPLTGRRHVSDPGREYTLVNYLIQGVAGEVLKMKLVELDAAGLGPYLRLPVHDEVDLSVPRGELDGVVATLRDVVNDDKLLTVPLTWSVSTGPSWGECD